MLILCDTETFEQNPTDVLNSTKANSTIILYRANKTEEGHQPSKPQISHHQTKIFTKSLVLTTLSLTWIATKMATRRLPIPIVTNQNACSTDRIDTGDWNKKPQAITKLRFYWTSHFSSRNFRTTVRNRLGRLEPKLLKHSVFFWEISVTTLLWQSIKAIVHLHAQNCRWV